MASTRDERSGELEEQRQPFIQTENLLPYDGSKAANVRHKRCLTTATVLCFALSIVLLLGCLWRTPSEKACIRKLNAWSPVLEAIEYHTVKPNSAERTRYTGLPTDRVEQSWDALWEFGSLGVAVESLPFLNKTVDERDWHYLPESLGGGVQAYIAGFHHLHCLNLIRQFTYRHERDYTYLHAFVNREISVLSHVEHCLEILRAKVMCESDTTLYPVHEDTHGNHKVYQPPARRCRHFKKMVHWAHGHITVTFDASQDA